MGYAAILGSRVVDTYATMEDAQADVEAFDNGWVMPIPDEDIEEFLYSYNTTTPSPLYYIPW